MNSKKYQLTGHFGRVSLAEIVEASLNELQLATGLDVPEAAMKDDTQGTPKLQLEGERRGRGRGRGREGGRGGRGREIVSNYHGYLR